MPAADIAAIMSPALPLKFMRSDELIDGAVITHGDQQLWGIDNVMIYRIYTSS